MKPLRRFVKKSAHSEFFRFLLVGISNTSVAYVVFLLLLPFMTYIYAYTLSYCVAVVNSYFMNVFFVFRKKISLHSFLKFPLVYVAQYFLGASILWALVGQLGLPPAWAMAVVIIVTVPVTFLSSRFVLKK
ncbi:MAG: GtrA family protein [Gallionella sp.]|nr:GtrA family protein [Gallionella sp.]